MSLDLHIHSTFSDGTMSPAELVALASKKGLSTISLTDHDTLEGFEPAVKAAVGLALEVISGLEISVIHGGASLHILGYAMDTADPGLNDALGRLQAGREKRNAAILERLAERGIVVSPEDLRRVSRSGQTGRPHIARLMLEKGAVWSMQEAFEKYLGRGACAYVSRTLLPAEEAIRLIRGAGGIVVLAHPLQVDQTLESLPALLRDLVPLGLDGLEGYYPTHSAKIRRKLADTAKKFGLLLTGGSDFHGDIKPGTTLAGGKNVYVPGEVIVIMKKLLESR
jgi:3',5'-nucleoside bisphosphate phosphatase